MLVLFLFYLSNSANFDQKITTSAKNSFWQENSRIFSICLNCVRIISWCHWKCHNLKCLRLNIWNSSNILFIFAKYIVYQTYHCKYPIYIYIKYASLKKILYYRKGHLNIKTVKKFKYLIFSVTALLVDQPPIVDPLYYRWSNNVTFTPIN